jgi:FkbM family methyltransferase
MRRVASRLARKLGVRRRPPVPFGVRWEDDVRALLGRAPSVVFDVGANVGQTVTAVRAAFPSAEIHAFEPVPSTFRTLTERVGHLPGVKLSNVALSAQRGRALVTDEPLSEWNTLEVGEWPDAPTAEIETSTVDDYLHECGVAHVDVMKIDTEGHEVSVLQGSTTTLSTGAASLLLVECDFRARERMPHARFSDLLHLLDTFDYRVVSFYCHGVDGEGWIWGDALFMRAGLINTTLGGARRPALPYQVDWSGRERGGARAR